MGGKIVFDKLPGCGFWLLVSFTVVSPLSLVNKLLRRKCMTIEFLFEDLLLVRKGEFRESLFLHLFFFRCLQLKVIRTSKWKILRWHTFNPYGHILRRHTLLSFTYKAYYLNICLPFLCVTPWKWSSVFCSCCFSFRMWYSIGLINTLVYLCCVCILFWTARADGR